MLTVGTFPAVPSWRPLTSESPLTSSRASFLTYFRLRIHHRGLLVDVLNRLCQIKLPVLLATDNFNYDSSLRRPLLRSLTCVSVNAAAHVSARLVHVLLGERVAREQCRKVSLHDLAAYRAVRLLKQLER